MLVVFFFLIVLKIGKHTSAEIHLIHPLYRGQEAQKKFEGEEEDSVSS